MNILKITKILSLGLVFSLFLFQTVLAGEVTGSIGSVDVDPEEVTSLATPLGLSATQVTGEIAVNLSWNSVTGATSYKVYRLGADSGWESAIAIATVTSGNSYKDSSGLVVDSYYYKVKAFTSSLESEFSEVSAISLNSVTTNTTTTTTNNPPSGGGGGGGSFTPSVATTPTTVTTVSGDSNNDGQVDILDFNSLMVNWGSTTVGSVADFNGDNKVDIFDFNFIMINWTV